MTEAILKIFKTELTEDKNAKVDDLISYLRLCDSYEIDDFQKVKNDLNIVIKINMEQKFENELTFNYASIKNDDEQRTYYYFIKNVKWVSQNTLAIELKMDTLNTFLDELEFDEDTHITRRHKDRFIQKQLTHTGVETIYRKVDKVDEGIQTNLYKLASQDIKANIPSTYQNLKWYLIYQTRENLTPTNINNPIICYMCADSDILLNGNFDNSLDKTNAINGIYYYISDIESLDASINVDSHIVGEYDGTDFTTGFMFKRENDNIRVYRLFTSSTSSPNMSYSNLGVFDKVTFNGVSKLKRRNDFDFSQMGNIWFFYYNASNDPEYKINGAYLLNIDSFDRTDSRIMKIIELPYCPIALTFTDDKLNVPTGFESQGGRLKLINIEEDFLNSQFNALPLNTMKFTFSNGATAKSILLSTTKEVLLESKLFNSNFYIDKISYDSFSKLIKYENINKTITTDQSANIQFKMSNNIVSKFAFKLTYNKDNEADLEDYEDFMIVQRNNELTLFNNNYIDYIRNGYNFDIKAKNQAQTSAVVSSTLGIAGAIASLIGGAVSGGVGIPLAIGTTTSVISNIASSINTQISTERNIHQKLQELESQATSVSNADDLNLLNYYNGNKLKRFVYKTSEAMTNLLFNLFYYGGYKCDEYAIPKHNTRVWFDFVQCEASFEEGDKQILSKYINDIKEKFTAGVTYYHKNIVYGLTLYDFEQKMENWESWIIE